MHRNTFMKILLLFITIVIIVSFIIRKFASENTHKIKQFIDIVWRERRTAKTSSVANSYSIYSNWGC